MKINVVEKYTAVVLELKGEITITAKDAEFNNVLNKLISEGKKNIIMLSAESVFSDNPTPLIPLVRGRSDSELLP